jgi:hypothetical protein
VKRGKNPLIPSEDDIAKLITDWLSYHNICWHNVPNRGRFDTGQDKKTPGAPDIVICYYGLYIAVEFKSPKGVQTPEQREFQYRLEQPKANGIYVLARDITDLIPVLEKISGHRIAV